MKKTISIVLVLALGLAAEAASAANINQAPIADAGLPRYAAYDPVVLDGTVSYDPDNSGPLSYAWRQIAGPAIVITDANTATPTISGFVQTSEIQECEFELVVSDGELTSLPDTVKVIIVPDFGARTLEQENPPFDPDKPTVIYFGGGNCITGRGSWGSTAWAEKANIISFPGYGPDPSVGGSRTYYRCGDMIIVYLSAAAPNYNQPIQTSGYSTGGQPAIDVGIHLNLSYADVRYAVNRVTFFDATGHCRDYSDSLSAFLGSSVDGEQCWADACVTTLQRPGWPFYRPFCENLLNVWFPTATGGWEQRHRLSYEWYKNSLMLADLNNFNHGVVAGAYWSVVGPGKNLQLASTPGAQTYKLQWYGDAYSGYMDFYDESSYPGRLPEPVTLVAWADVLEPKGVVLTCRESENAVGYKLLFGTEPHRVQDYEIVSDTPTPPTDAINDFPSEETWWTIKAYDQYGSTIYADPMCLNPFILSLPIENLTTGKRYGYIQHAIDDAAFGDEIVLREGTYYANIYFKGKNITLRATDPNDPVVVAATVIDGGDHGSVVTVSGTQETDCVLTGLTIIGGIVGVSCRAGSLTIRNCTIGSNGPNAIEFWYGYEPTIIDCTILGQIKENDPRLIAHWKLDEAEGSIAYDSAAVNDGILNGGPLWQPTSGQINGALEFDGIDDYVSTPFVLDPRYEDREFSVFAWIKGGTPGHVVLSQIGVTNWLCTDPSEGKLMTEFFKISRGARGLLSQTVITDGNWHRIGLVWDGSNLTLYVDDVEEARDTQSGLEGTYGGLHLGAGWNLYAGSFFSGLIDDVRIYNRAITP